MKRLFTLLCGLPFFALSVAAGPLQDMINAATNDAVIAVPAGTYNEAIALKPGQTLVSDAGPDQTIIDGQKATFTVVGAKDSMLIGFTVRGGLTGIQNTGNFIGVFECVITGYSQSGIDLEKGSAAIANNLISGGKGGTGVNCTEANPYVGYNIIACNRVGFQSSRWMIPTLDHNVFTSNDIAVVSADGTEIAMNGNIFAGNGQNALGVKLGTNDQVRAATPSELALRRGMTVDSYRGLMKKVFAEAAAMQPRITYDLTDMPGKFNLIITYPFATFTVSASARDTVIKSYDAYDRQTDASLNAQYCVLAGGYPTVAVINPQLKDKNFDRYVLEKVFEHLPSYNNTPDGRRVFSRLTNLPRIEVLLPAGWTMLQCNIPGATVEQRGNRECVKMLSMGMTQIQIALGKVSP